MTGEALFNLLLDWLKKLNLDAKNIVGQSYDGASSMRGEYKGVATRLKEVAPCGVYIHCNGHILNLCLVDVSSRIQSVRNNFGIISSLYNLIEDSAKRHHMFEQIQQEAGLKALTIKA